MLRKRTEKRNNKRRLTITQRRASLQRLQDARQDERQQSASLWHKSLMRKKRIEARRPKHYTYLDCLRDESPVPTGVNGTTLYQFLMIGGMTAVSVTTTGVSGGGLGFLLYGHWVYPVMFSISFLVKVYLGMPLAKMLNSALVDGRLRGVASGAAKTVLGSIATAPITGAITTFLFADATDIGDYANAYLASLSVTLPTSVVVGYFVVGPLTNLLFNNHIKPTRGLRILQTLSEHAHSIARAFGF